LGLGGGGWGGGGARRAVAQPPDKGSENAVGKRFSAYQYLADKPQLIRDRPF
jgi:hypothetical protein